MKLLLCILISCIAFSFFISCKKSHTPAAPVTATGTGPVTVTVAAIQEKSGGDTRQVSGLKIEVVSRFA